MKSERKPRVIFVLGGPGSGKGTQCKLILQNNQKVNFIHISTGSALRQATKEETPENKEIVTLMKEGKMVPSSLLVKLLRKSILEKGSENIYILDGFPRNKQNLSAWDEIIADEFDVKFLLYFEVAEEELRRRLMNRAKTSGRVDDNAETIEKRLKTFKEETQPMLEGYKRSEIVSIDSNVSIEKIAEGVQENLKKRELI